MFPSTCPLILQTKPKAFVISKSFCDFFFITLFCHNLFWSIINQCCIDWLKLFINKHVSNNTKCNLQSAVTYEKTLLVISASKLGHLAQTREHNKVAPKCEKYKVMIEWLVFFSLLLKEKTKPECDKSTKKCECCWLHQN